MIPSVSHSLHSAGLGLTIPAAGQPGPAAQPGEPDNRTAGATVGASSPISTTPEMRQYPEPPKSALEKALDAVNDNLKAWSTGMRFDMDDDTKRLVISIVDSATGDVIRTIPSDAVLQVAKMIVKLQGAGIDTHA